MAKRKQFDPLAMPDVTAFDDTALGLSGDDNRPDKALDTLFDAYYRPEVNEPATRPDDYVSDVEEENKRLLHDLEYADKFDRMQRNRDALKSGVETEYYVSIVFVTEEQKLAFLKALDWLQFGGERFLNGIDLAAHLKVELPEGYLVTNLHKVGTPPEGA